MGINLIYYYGYFVAEDVYSTAKDGAKDIIPRRLRRSKLFRRSKGSKSASPEEPEHYNPTTSEEECSKSFTSEDTSETVIHYSSEDKQSELDQYIFSNDSKESTDTIIHDETVKISRRQRCKAKLRKCLSSKTLKAKFSAYNLSSDECVELEDEIVSDNHIIAGDHIVSDNHDDVNNDVHLDNIVNADSIAVTEDSGASGNVYQKKQWSVSDYSLSIYSQDGIDTVVVSPKEREINNLKAKLFNQELENKKLRSKISQLSSEPTSKSASEAESVIHTAFETVKVSELSSDTPTSNSGSISESVIHTPLETTKVSHRQRYRAKIRECLSSTQEILAPLKALHPNNRAERGHTKQQAKEALEALQNAPTFFESVPFESTEEGEAPTFYCPRHGTCSSHFAWCFCDYHPSAAHRQSEIVDDWLLPAWRALVTKGIEEDRAEKARIEEQARMEEQASKEEQAMMEEKTRIEEQARMEEKASIEAQSEPQRFSAEEYIDLISDLTDDYLGYSRSKSRSHKRSKSKKRVERVVEEKMEEQALPIQEYSELQRNYAEDYVGPASDRADDYLGVTGYNPRTGTLDNSKKSKKNKEHRRVRWASTEKGWESKAASSSSPSAECTKENEKMEVPFLV
ncbi:uncharacterized protein EAF02_008345 [Botrytis sinoallii]|uniref:uncharacterized protein n=1 Tax=Botrytis sinoallii TaxID=1463999 RepID=UPI0019022848|nr:uncharacterized protein EAF02_008345 [Botrytis sinoallii]KAF7877125.1 hypothetical protein EAF02_008345 [Botrytis sinoallii]